jgi:hypothetical protein
MSAGLKIENVVPFTISYMHANAVTAALRTAGFGEIGRSGSRCRLAEKSQVRPLR